MTLKGEWHSPRTSIHFLVEIKCGYNGGVYPTELGSLLWALGMVNSSMYLSTPTKNPVNTALDDN